MLDNSREYLRAFHQTCLKIEEKFLERSINDSRKLKISCSLEIEEKILGRSINDGRSLEE